MDGKSWNLLVEGSSPNSTFEYIIEKDLYGLLMWRLKEQSYQLVNFDKPATCIAWGASASLALDGLEWLRTSLCLQFTKILQTICQRKAELLHYIPVWCAPVLAVLAVLYILPSLLVLFMFQCFLYCYLSLVQGDHLQLPFFISFWRALKNNKII